MRALIVHGNDLCGEFYAPLSAALARRGVAAACPTLPGFRGEPPLSPASAQGLVAHLLRSFEGGALIGHSLGGRIAYLAAARRPPGLTHLILLEPMLLPWRLLGALAAWRYRREVVHGDRSSFVNQVSGLTRIADPARFPAAAMALYLECRRLGDTRTTEVLLDSQPEPAPLSVPTLLIYGARSGAGQRALGLVLAARLGARRVVVPDAAHFLANESDDAVAHQIAAFLGAA